MQNKEIADAFKLLVRLSELYEENPFVIRSYRNATIEIEDLPWQLSEMTDDQIKEIPGVGKAIHEKIRSLLDTGEMAKLKELLSITPNGVVKMLRIRGLGAKKILALWKVHHIESLEDLLETCNTDRLVELPGFGKKS
ncbi:MAG: DNA polymerase/3'-5' exonuclease PolX, partial [Bacteroidetes bacterium]|nr:DNA polymerase/3'-5' exonuclease PolX [Bacteroidota bacterium]